MSRFAFFRRAGTFGMGAAINGVVRLALVSVLARLLSVAEYGVYTTVYSVIGVVTVFCTFGMDEATSREFFDHRPSAPSLRSFVHNVLVFVGLTSTLIAGLTWVFVASGLLGSGAVLFVREHGPVIVVICMLTSMMGILNVLLVARQMSFLYVAGQSLRLLGLLGLTALLAGHMNLGLTSVFWADGASLAVLVTLLFNEFNRSHDRASERTLVVAPEKLRATFRYALPFVLYSLTNWVVSASDRLVLAKYCSLEEVGRYGLGYTLATGMNTVILSGINMAYAPVFLRNARAQEGYAARYARDLELYVLGVGLLALFLMLFSPEAVRIIAPRRYLGAAPIMSVVVFGFFLQGMYLMFSLPLTLHRRSAAIAGGSLLAAAMNLGLNLLLVPTLGITAAAWTTVVGYLAMAVFAAHRARPLYPAKIRYLALIGPVAATLALGLIAGNWPLGWRVVVAGLASGVVAIIGRVALQQRA